MLLTLTRCSLVLPSTLGPRVTRIPMFACSQIGRTTSIRSDQTPPANADFTVLAKIVIRAIGVSKACLSRRCRHAMVLWLMIPPATKECTVGIETSQREADAGTTDCTFTHLSVKLSCSIALLV